MRQKQKYYLTDDDRKLWPMPPIEEELELIRLYGSQTLAITLNSYDLTKKELESATAKIGRVFGLTSCLSYGRRDGATCSCGTGVLLHQKQKIRIYRVSC